MKFLIDECLTPDLVEVAAARGFYAAHVVYHGLAATKDWNLMTTILQSDWTLVTKNAVDFRGPAAAPGTGGEYAKLDLHAGLICRNVGNADSELQGQVFEAVLDWLGAAPDLINRALEARVDGDAVAIDEYDLPLSNAENPSGERAG